MQTFHKKIMLSFYLLSAFSFSSNENCFPYIYMTFQVGNFYKTLCTVKSSENQLWTSVKSLIRFGLQQSAHGGKLGNTET